MTEYTERLDKLALWLFDHDRRGGVGSWGINANELFWKAEAKRFMVANNLVFLDDDPVKESVGQRRWRLGIAKAGFRRILKEG
jgi:hypothetical protein